jgi:T6SS, Phospholipase effector Tle1-like, catalytic domain
MQLIVCCDGTWNDPSTGTHIRRTFDAARAVFRDLDNAHYDKGVGTEKDERLSGGALGRGLSQNVRQAYQWLVRHYADGDQLFVFGFSRGAYTVRSLTGFLNYAGLLQQADEHRIEDAYEAYRLREHERVRTGFHDSGARARARRIQVRFLGVFDTVGALGVPLDWVKTISADLPHLNVQFHDTRLCGNVDVACQALAIDEQRGPYEPTWWEEPGPGTPRPEKVLQVWFAGAHSDIGGGYPDDKSLAEVPLGWMLEQAREAGLDLSGGLPAWPVRGDPGGLLHDSLSLGWRFVHLLPHIDPYRRPIGAHQREARRLPPIPGEKLHWSVIDRIQGTAAARLRPAYRPASLMQGDALRPLDLPVFRDRAEPRRPEERPATIDGGVAVTLLDRSPSGARIRADGALPLLPRLRLRVDDTERSYEVRWRRGRELGLRVAA